MRLTQPLKILFAVGAVCLWCAGMVHGQIASNITGLYYTGMNSKGGLVTPGKADSNWNVTFVSTTGTNGSNNTKYTGDAYVISGTLPGGYVGNSNNAQWITAPTDKTYAGPSLPGYGTANHEGVYVYTLAFNVVGTGSGTVTTPITITLGVAADDQFAIYVNPSNNGNSIPTSGASFTSDAGAWTGTTDITLTNGTTGTNGNSRFVVGTNYMVIVVDNTDSGNNSGGNNATGLLVYQVGDMLVGNNPIQGVIPEVGAWLPVAAAMGLFLWSRRRRRPAARGSVA
jgi:hypothetical protein